MKKELIRWAKNKAEDLQEISEEISWEFNRAKEKVKAKTVEAVQLSAEGLRKKFSPPEPEEEALRPVIIVTEEDLRQELTQKLDDAIHHAYYKEGGFQYFGDELMRYVKVVLPTETEMEYVWAAGYNSCIGPMIRQLEKLEKELDEIMAQAEQEPLPLNNENLLRRMQNFEAKAMEDKLHMGMGWTLEDYRQALGQYAEELNGQLLTPYRMNRSGNKD